MTYEDGIKRMCLEKAKDYQEALLPYRPFPGIADRNYWEGLDDKLKQELVAAGGEALKKPYPQILATDFMDFKRTGNRKNYEDIFFGRRYILNSCVLAECVENKGRFLDHIINGIFAICEESAWALPAHNSYLRDHPQEILPDLTRPIIELFACETGETLAMVNYLLAPVLDAFSPFITKRIRSELRRRIIDPYLHEHFWWMGNGSEPMCNWTPWCTQNVLLTAFLTEGLVTEEERITIFEKASESLDLFLKDYGEDGCCDEGAQYYRHAGLCLFGALDILNKITGNAFQEVMLTQKVKNIAAYISIVHVSGPRYFNFEDCSPMAGAAGVREYLFGKATDQKFLMDFAARDFETSYEAGELLKDESQQLNLYYRTQSVNMASEVLTYAKTVDHVANAPDIFYPSVGIWIARDDTYALAVKAGDNDDSHNHNDVGSIILYKDGQPILADIGVETYTGKTFSPDRYEIWTMRSEYHNTPTIAGINQMNGPDYKATDVYSTLEGPVKTIRMELAQAYPDLPAGTSYLREVSLNTLADTITIIDSCDNPDVTLNFITYEEPVITDNLIRIGDAAMLIDHPLEITYETLPITDARLQTAWDHDLYRIFVKTDGTAIITIR